MYLYPSNLASGSSICLPFTLVDWMARMGLRLPVYKQQLEKTFRQWCNSAMLATQDSTLEPEDDELANLAEQDLVDIRECLGGNGESYNRIVERYQLQIAESMWRFTRNRQQWEELVQDVFVEAYLSLGTYSGRAPLVHWLRRIATRVGYRFWKKQRKLRLELSWTSESEQQTTNEQTTSTATEAVELVHLLLAELAPRDRLVMTLSYLEDRSIVEVADLTGWSKSMVKVQLHRARKRLAKICNERGVEL